MLSDSVHCPASSASNRRTPVEGHALVASRSMVSLGLHRGVLGCAAGMVQVELPLTGQV